MKKKTERKYLLLSEQTVCYEYRFCYCLKCKNGYENDKLASQVRCPVCGQVMENLSEQALDNRMKENERLAKERIERINGGHHQ